jgi:hypothetical protein
MILRVPHKTSHFSVHNESPGLRTPSLRDSARGCKSGPFSFSIFPFPFTIFHFHLLLARAVFSDDVKSRQSSLFSSMIPRSSSAFRISLRSIMRSQMNVSFNSFKTIPSLCTKSAWLSTPRASPRAPQPRRTYPIRPPSWRGRCDPHALELRVHHALDGYAVLLPHLLGKHVSVESLLKGRRLG